MATIALFAALAATASPANAAPVEFGQTYTVGDASAPCAGTIAATAVPGPSDVGRAGEVVVYLRGALNGPAAAFGNPRCAVPATVHWRNVTSGAAGAVSVLVVTVGGQPALPLPRVVLASGAGHVSAIITTPVANVPGRAEIDVG